MIFEEAHEFGIDLESMFAQELGGLALAPTNINVKSPPANILVNRVPEGYTPILIDLQRCSRSELQRFLHKMLCQPQLSEQSDIGNSAPKEVSAGRCGCKLIEFDYQPDFMFKRDHVSQSDEDIDSADNSSDDSDSSDDESNDGNNTSALESESNNRILLTRHEEETERTKIKIKRPPNSFMIYRSERHIELVKKYKGGNKVISGIIAKEWHNMKPEEKKKYEDMAAAKKHEHEMLYPNYKFMPKRRRL